MCEPESITNHPASTETAENAKLKDASVQPGPKEKTPTIDDHNLPKGMAEKVETVETSTMKVNK